MNLFEWSGSYHLQSINNLSARASCIRLILHQRMYSSRFLTKGFQLFFFFSFFFWSFWSSLTAFLSPFPRSQTIMFYPLTLFITYLLSVDNNTNPTFLPSPLSTPWLSCLCCRSANLRLLHVCYEGFSVDLSNYCLVIHLIWVVVKYEKMIKNFRLWQMRLSSGAKSTSSFNSAVLCLRLVMSHVKAVFMPFKVGLDLN